jgi:hypothetical protein
VADKRGRKEKDFKTGALKAETITKAEKIKIG